MDRFQTYDAGLTAFLRTFWEEKMVSQHLEKLRTLSQETLLVEDYVARFCMLLQRVPPAQQPAQEVVNDYFLWGLIQDLWSSLATVDKAATPLKDIINDAIRAGESLAEDT